MATYTDRIVLVFPIAAKNRQAAASLQTLEITDAGNEFEKLVPLDPALVSQYASAFNLSLLAKVTELEADLATTTSQLDATTQAKTTLETQAATLTEQLSTTTTQLSSATAEISTLTAKVAELEATIVELTPPPKPESVTPAQIRLWLIANGISLGTVAQMIAAIPHEATREAASVRWEYGLVVLRDDPLVQQMGASLGFTSDQMDVAFLAASQIV